jgi:hypothetical protein
MYLYTHSFRVLPLGVAGLSLTTEEIKENDSEAVVSVFNGFSSAPAPAGWLRPAAAETTENDSEASVDVICLAASRRLPPATDEIIDTESPVAVVVIDDDDDVSPLSPSRLCVIDEIIDTDSSGDLSSLGIISVIGVEGEKAHDASSSSLSTVLPS